MAFHAIRDGTLK